MREDRQLTAGELRAGGRAAPARYKVPKHVEFRDSLPRTAVGKVLRRALVAADQT